MWSIRLNMMASQIPLREIPVIERGRTRYAPPVRSVQIETSRPISTTASAPVGAAPECFDAHNRILKPGHDHCGSEMPDKHYAINKPGQNKGHISPFTGQNKRHISPFK
jgi:hypothetical protein